jgi:hypothetical protein
MTEGERRRATKRPYNNMARFHAPAISQARKTHCPQGHAYNEANTYHDSHGKRQCRHCKRDRKAAKRLETAS